MTRASRALLLSVFALALAAPAAAFPPSPPRLGLEVENLTPELRKFLEAPEDAGEPPAPRGHPDPARDASDERDEPDARRDPIADEDHPDDADAREQHPSCRAAHGIGSRDGEPMAASPPREEREHEHPGPDEEHRARERATSSRDEGDAGEELDGEEREDRP